MTTAPRHDGGIVVTAALTGPVATKDDHPGLPCSPEEIAAAAAAAGKAGASVVHVHLRDEHGRPTADLGIAARAMDLIGESSDTIIQLSTGVGAGVSWQDRAKLVELRPRMASLNVCTMTFGNVEFRNPPDDVRRLAYRMGELGVKPELEIYDTGHLDFALALAEEGLLEPPLQFSVVMGIRGGMSPTPRNLLHTVSLLPQDAVWQIVAIGRAHLPLLTLAIALGGNARTGLEDTLMLTRGIQAPDNTALVRRAVEIAALYGRTPSTATTPPRTSSSKTTPPASALCSRTRTPSPPASTPASTPRRCEAWPARGPGRRQRDGPGRNARRLPPGPAGAGRETRARGKAAAQFLAWLARRDMTAITADAALTWARQPGEVSAGWLAMRMRAVRGFAGFCRSLDGTAEVPRHPLPLPLASLSDLEDAEGVGNVAD